jgi:hypothetical protein
MFHASLHHADHYMDNPKTATILLAMAFESRWAGSVLQDSYRFTLRQYTYTIEPA